MKIKPETIKTLLALTPIPFIWMLLAHFGALDKMENALLDIRFKLRGELLVAADEVVGLKDAPKAENQKDSGGKDALGTNRPRVVYVDFDQQALSSPEAGERPWDRKFFAKAARLLLDERVGARSVGYDFIFSSKSMSKMVPEENVFNSESKIRALVEEYPDRVVLGANYTSVHFNFMDDKITSNAPLVYKDGYKKEMTKNYPEAPTYPIIHYKDGREYGRIGVLAAEMERSNGAIPRWAPLYFPYSGDAHAKMQLLGLQFAHPIETKQKETEEAFAAAKAEYQQVSEANTAIDKQIAKLQGEIAELQKSKPKGYMDLLEKFAQVNKVVEEKDAAVQQILKAIQANPAAAAALQKGIQANVAGRDAAKKELDVLKSTIAGDQAAKVKQAQAALKKLEETAKSNPALAATLGPAIENNKKTLQEAGQALALLEAELQNAELLASIQKLKVGVANADASLKQLEAAAKANPAAAAAFQNGINTNKAAKEAALKKLDAAKKAISENKLLAGFQARLDLRDKQLEEDVRKWTEKLAETKEELEAIDAQSEVTTQMLLSTERDLEAARLRKDSIHSDAFDRDGITFEKKDTPEGGLWYLKDGDKALHEIPAKRVDDNYYHFAFSLILSAYGLDGNNVKITDEKILIQDDAGKIIVDAPLVDRQLIEVNWFSQWRKDLPDITARENMGMHRDNTEHDAFFKAAEAALLGAIERAGNKQINDLAQVDEALQALGIPNDARNQAESLVAKINKHDGTESLDEWHDLAMNVLNELSRKSMPPFITSKYNPRCSIVDIFNYGEFFLDATTRSLVENYDDSIAQIDAAIANLKTQVAEDPSLADQAAPLIAKAKLDRDNLLETKEDFERAETFFSHFKNAIVLIGPVDPTFQDLAPTPFDSSPVPKVGVHGNLIKTLLTGKYINRLGSGAEVAGIFGLGFLMIFLGVYNGPMSTMARPLGILLQLIYLVVAFFVFKNSHLVLPVAGPVGSALSTTFIGLAIKLIIEEKAKGRIKGMFGSYVSSDLVEQMVDSGEEPSLGGEEQKITAYFSDVQAFSAFSELLSPTGLVDLMNEYLTAMTDILQEERGTLDKYIGDAIVAMYGAPIPMPDHAYQGVKTAVLMQMRQLELREKWMSEGDKWPDIVGKMQTRIGLNTGTATVGNMGSHDRFNYTMMGDMVNLAARSESGAKAYGAYIMITEDTKRTAEEQGSGIAYRYLDKIVVKGRTQPVEMYEVTGFWDDLSQDSKDCLDLFQQGIDNYLKQDWGTALDLFERAKELEPNKPGITPGVKDNPSMILIDRVKSMSENPPGDDWDGVYIMTSK